MVTSVAALVYAPAMGGVLDLTRQVTTVGGAQVTTYNYQLIFWGALIIAALTVLAMLAVYVKFVSYGGTRSYIAPGDDDKTPARPAPPAHMTQIMLLYMLGAAIGLTAGYILGFLIQHGAASRAGVGLGSFHKLLFQDKDVRNVTTFCVATGVIPFTALGGWAGTTLARKRNPSAQPAHA
jgi:hypothetical protein